MKKAIYVMLMLWGLFFLCQIFPDTRGWISYAAQPLQDPILRIETGMHTAGIDRIGIDVENRYLVTGSLDKTIRIWELDTGRLLNTIRPPIGEQDKGRITAVAISPDGRSIACGGRAIVEPSCSIYIFDR